MPFATPPTQVYAVLGPAIGACCYTLDRRRRTFSDQFPAWEQFFIPHGPGALDHGPAHRQHASITAAGVPAAQIDTASICTACHKHNLYSHRAEGQEAGRGMAIVALTSPVRPS